MKIESKNLKENILKITRQPLAGTTLSNFLKLLAQNKFKIHPLYMPRFLYAFSVCMLLTPLRIIEHLKFDKKVKNTEIKHPPLFILGHQRSGTTYLHNILSLDENFGYFTTFDAFFPSISLGFEGFIKPFITGFMPEKRPMDNVKMGTELPQEEEFAIAAISKYSAQHTIAFPDNYEKYSKYTFMENVSKREIQEWKKAYKYILKKETIKNKKKRLLLKSPTNTSRVKVLLEMFPNAKFINIYRNPYHVYKSKMNFLKKLGPLFTFQKFPTIEELEKHVIINYKKMYKNYFKERKLIPKKNLIEIKYEDLIEDPMNQLKEIYSHLSLPGFKENEGKFKEYLKSKKNYKKTKYELDEKTKKRVSKEWKFSFEEFGYEI